MSGLRKSHQSKVENNTTIVLKFQVIPGSWDCDFLEEEEDSDAQNFASGLMCSSDKSEEKSVSAKNGTE